MKVGTIVQLKSGGPLLTVVDISNTIPDRLAVNFDEKEFLGSCRCRWFDLGGALHEDDFLVETLNEMKLEDQ